MKTKLITNLKKNVLLVDGLPENAERLEVVRITNPNYISYTEGKTRWNHNLPEGNWQLLGKLKDLTNLECEDLVPLEPISEGSEFVGYPIFTRKGASVNHAKESFLSALEASGLHLNGNPLSEEIHAPDIDEWQEAELNVFSQETLVFVES